uniref:Uncharacterized protein n=1 Tax=Cannabis sativa TaxID=3483 RepID=A0A803QAC3_CANSA
MAADTPRNEENQLGETTQRLGNEHQTSHRTNTIETPHFGRNGGEFEQTGDEILERQSEDAYDPTRYVLLVELENRATSTATS